MTHRHRDYPFIFSPAGCRLSMAIALAICIPPHLTGCVEGSTISTASVAKEARSASLSEELDDAIAALKSGYIAVRIEAIEKLGKWKVEPESRDAEKIIKALVDFRADEYNDFEDQYVDNALRSLGDVAVQEIRRLVDTGEDRAISTAIMVMRSMGEQWTPKFQDSIKTLFDSSDPDDVWQGMYTLEELGASGLPFVDQVARQMQSQDFQVQQIALRAIGSIGPDAIKYLPKIRKLANDGQNISVKSHAMIAMGRIAAGSPAANEVATQLLGYLDEKNFVLKQRCLTGLIALGKDAAPATERSKVIMETDTNGLAAQAAYLYGITSENWDEAAKRLGLLTRDATVCFEALDFLKKAGPNAKPATEMLLVMTRNEDESLSSPAVQALAAIYRTPDKSDPDFQKVTKRFAELASGEINEAGYIAEKCLQQWKEAGLITATAAQNEAVIEGKVIEGKASKSN